MRMLAWTMAHHMAVLCCVYADIQYKECTCGLLSAASRMMLLFRVPLQGQLPMLLPSELSTQSIARIK